jgi:hypothetical protein
VTVSIRHVPGTRVPVTVVEGIDHDAAALHLARDLGTGSAFATADAVVVDLAAIRDISEPTLLELDGAARTWRREHRWLAVTGLPTARAVALLDGQRYLSVSAAVAGAQRFYRLVAGPGSRRDRVVALAGAALGFAEAVTVAGVTTAARIGTAVPCRIVRLVNPDR